MASGDWRIKPWISLQSLRSLHKLHPHMPQLAMRMGYPYIYAKIANIGCSSEVYRMFKSISYTFFNFIITDQAELPSLLKSTAARMIPIFIFLDIIPDIITQEHNFSKLERTDQFLGMCFCHKCNLKSLR